MFMVESTGEDRCRTKKPEATVAGRGVAVAVAVAVAVPRSRPAAVAVGVAAAAQAALEVGHHNNR